LEEHTAFIFGPEDGSMFSKTFVQFAFQVKVPARNSIYMHPQDFTVSDELILTILKAFVPQPLNKQQRMGDVRFSRQQV
jgi:hypothetical protein